MILIDTIKAEVDVIINAKDLWGEVVDATGDIKSMTNVLAGHWDDDGSYEDLDEVNRLNRRLPQRQPLAGPFHDGKPVTWDAWKKFNHRGSIIEMEVAKQMEHTDDSLDSMEKGHQEVFHTGSVRMLCKDDEGIAI